MTELKVDGNGYMPLRDVAYQTLRKAILRGDLQPGERLMEMKLADQMGVSRTPVREAIRMLELDGLVVMTPRKGASVAQLSDRSLRDVLEVRRALEQLAGELACERMTKKDFDDLAEANRRFTEVIDSEDVTTVAEADEYFHSLIFKATGNEKLIQLVSQFREQMYRFRIEHIKDLPDRDILIREHQEIMQALRKRDVELTKKCIGDHILLQEQNIAKHIQAQ